MAGRLTWSPTARRDLREILAYIADDDPVAGRTFAGRAFEIIRVWHAARGVPRLAPRVGDAQDST